MNVMAHGIAGAYFILRFLHFGVERFLSHALGLPFPIAEALTWVIVAVIAAVIYKKWRR